MTMPVIADTAPERSSEAQRLIDSAADVPFEELVTLSALELCVLGAPRQALFEEPVASAWTGLDKRRRGRLIEETTAAMVARRLLAPDPRQPADDIYVVQPALGIVLAARSRPAWIVLTETARPDLRTPRLFAFGDVAEPVRGVVVEEPAALPAAVASGPAARKLGPLARLYRYVLVSQDRAAQVLAEWAIAPPPAPPATGPAAGPPPARAVALYHPANRDGEVGARVSVRGDGSTASVAADPALAPDPARSYDQAALAQVMLGLLAVGQPR
jgi:hypothetical protein